MQFHANEFVVIQTGALQTGMTQIKPQRLYQMQSATGVRAQTDDISCVWWYLWLIQYKIEHFLPPWSLTMHDPRLAVDYCGLKFHTPLVLLSGCVGFGEEYTRVEGFSNQDAGAICLKGTTGGARPGNAPHRVYETPGGMLNAIGLQNPGVDQVISGILPKLDFEETRFIANVSGSTLEEYEEVTRKFDDSPIDAIEINISCPNVKEGGVAFGNDPDMSARVVEACRKVTNKPLITKLSPNQTDIAHNAKRCIEAGTDGLAVINTLMAWPSISKAAHRSLATTKAGFPARRSSRWHCSRYIRSTKWPKSMAFPSSAREASPRQKMPWNSSLPEPARWA